MKSLFLLSEYPELENNPKWTENSPEYCSCCTAMSPNTNILDSKYYEDFFKILLKMF